MHCLHIDPRRHRRPRFETAHPGSSCLPCLKSSEMCAYTHKTFVFPQRLPQATAYTELGCRAISARCCLTRLFVTIPRTGHTC
ncbi:uncharacterized protein B0H18DRAFT_989347 [Fomitopsis serialis]|uniref:uncharacterized protein n=1 Tax=Fomitopsis serialis TaxID=139415 RepID=UPI0020078C83|nr:uncharacterized protein B0H18DRAFT_989347 [Neoantrodia serialis]KAH9931442.1 hypothetical protein B0H18DRAFT_989347 [Neoantrodia serialis]